jgi:CRISPR type III-B/RAMP module RAMP protein Cmr6
MELNLFSYIQSISVVYNVGKEVSREVEELSESLYGLEEAIKRNKRIEKRKEEVRKKLENVKSKRRILQVLESLEPVYPDRVFIMLNDFITRLDQFLGIRYYNRTSLNEIHNLVEEMEKFKQKLEKIHYIEFAVNSAKLCKSLLNDIKNAYEELGFDTAYFEASLVERGLFGASQSFGKLLFEIALEWDPYFNVPIIPGSSIKGAFRAAYNNLRKPDWPATDEVFGSSEPEAKAGDLIFSDAYPVKPGFNEMLLYPDILNPHYSKEGKDILGEIGWEPVPNPYLTVAPGVTFGFLIASPERRRHRLSWDKLSEVVKAALDIGLGGKTCIGYGRFSFNVRNVKLHWGGEKG